MDGENQKKTRLGKGLDAFFAASETKSDLSSDNNIGLQQIALDKIKIAPWQPRKDFEEIEG